MSNNRYTSFIYTALACEAKPLISYFELKKLVSVSAFDVYCKDGLCLTVTGVGKSAMAAAVGYTQALYAADSPLILLNIGIAGHASHAIGLAYLIDKISDFDSGKNHYPPIVFKTAIPTASLQTVSKPLPGYPGNALFDMEASAFYETAARFTTGELVQCLKIISDNNLSPVDNIHPQQVSGLITTQMPAIQLLLTELSRQAGRIADPEPEMVQYFLQRYRFTVNEVMQLNNQLLRWQVLTGHEPLDDTGINLGSGKEFLKWLNQKISALAYSL